VCYSLSFTYASLLIFLYIIICCVVLALTCAIAASAAVPHFLPSSATLRQKSDSAAPYYIRNSLSAWTIICLMIIYLTQCASPHMSMDVGGAPSHSLKVWTLASYANLRIQLSIHTFRGRLYTHRSIKSQLHFISFVSSKWVVINHQKGRDWKCNQALIVSFGENDHAIRELIRFIEMTSREFIFEDATW